MSKHKIPNVQSVLTAETDTEATLYFYGTIGQEKWYDDSTTEPLTDLEIVKTVNEYVASGKIRINSRLNSYGGSMKHGEAIINTLKNSGIDTHMYVDGIAASMAAYMFLSVKKENRHMARNSKLMFHASAVSTYGNADALRAQADMLDVFDAAAIAQMAADTGMTEDEIREAYFDGNDHWLSSQQALNAGLIVAIENYDAENIPDNVESMTQEEINSFYNPVDTKVSPLDRAKRFFGQVAAVVVPEKKPQPITTENSTDMNIEEFNAAIADGSIKMEDVAAKLTEGGYKVEAPAPALTPQEVSAQAMTTAVTAAVNAAVTPLNETIASLQAKVTALGRMPGAEPAVATTAVDPASAPTLTEAQAKLKAENEAMAADVNTHDRARFTV